jgi:cell division protein FtsB
MTLTEALQVIGAIVAGGTAIATIVLKLLEVFPARIKALADARQLDNEELRKQRAEKDREIAALKVENQLLEEKAQYYMSEAYRIRDDVVMERARCEAKGLLCQQEFKPVILKPYIPPVHPPPTPTTTQ